jgi:catalase
MRHTGGRTPPGVRLARTPTSSVKWRDGITQQLHRRSIHWQDTSMHSSNRRIALPRPLATALLVLVAFGAKADGVAAPVPQAAVAALNKLSGGPHAGYRANHAKGVLLTGRFAAASTARAISKAAHLKSGRSVPVVVRFSNGTGVPDLPDADPNASPHGMAIRFRLPDGSNTDIVAISARSFPVAKPEEFVELLSAIADSGPNVPKPAPIETFMAKHPRAAAWAHTPRPPPKSFATLAFYGVNAFKFTNKAGDSHFIRYQILPEAGEHALSADEAKAATRDYLMDEIKERVTKGPARFRLVAQVAEAGDPTDDGSVAWPDSRRIVELGVITIDKVSKDQVGEQKKLMFTPLALTDGIEASNDPVLLVRPAAYAVSFAQRTQ